MTLSALDLKYRPVRFSEVVGNSSVVKLLSARSRSGTLAGRSMMFGGPKGCGKTTLARVVARAIACNDLRGEEPCGECTACIEVTSNSSTSTDEFDAATQGTVDRIRSILDDLEYGTFDGKPRVIILDEAQRLSKSSQDALLKAIEDRRFVIILCTTEPHKIGEAIRSRVEEYSVVPPPSEEIVARMEAICNSEGIEFHRPALLTVAAALGNCPRTCISALSTLSTLGPISEDSARNFFRFGNMEALGEVLTLIDSNSTAALELLDQIMGLEGPSWTRDTIVHAIASAMRESVGAKATFPVKTRFFPVRGRAWADLARDLSRIDKPTAPDIEACLLSSCAQVPIVGAPAPPILASPSTLGPAPVITVQTEAPNPVAGIADRLEALFNKSPSITSASPPAPPPPPPPTSAPVSKMRNESVKPVLVPSGNLFAKPAPRTVEAAKLPRARTIEVDGIAFSSDEALTSLDAKIDKGPSQPVVEPPSPTAEVELDKSRRPMAEKEFARGFVQRVKQNV